MNLLFTVKVCVVVLTSLQLSFAQNHEFEWQNRIAAKSSKSIKDYFLLLPSKYLDCENINSGFAKESERVNLIELEDIENGYIEFLKSARIVVFRNRVDNVDVIGIQIGRCGAGNSCGAVNTLLEFKNNEWVSRRDLLPERNYPKKRDNGEPICSYFDLPRHGTTISVRDEFNDDSVVAQYQWTGRKFELK